jgi:photoactive yellow protein
MYPDFSSSEMFMWLENQDEAVYNDLPFGLIRMTAEGIILNYNKAESDIAGVTPGNAIGKHFFTEVAPCTNNFLVAEKYTSPELDEELDYIFTYITQPTKVRLRLLRSTGYTHQYLLVKKR